MEKVYKLYYSWEPKDKSDDGANHIYALLEYSEGYVVVNIDKKYLCGLDITDINDLREFEMMDKLTHSKPELQKTLLCPICNKILNEKFPLNE